MSRSNVSDVDVEVYGTYIIGVVLGVVVGCSRYRKPTSSSASAYVYGTADAKLLEPLFRDNDKMLAARLGLELYGERAPDAE